MTVKFGTLMPIHGARAVLLLVYAHAPFPPSVMLDNLLSKVIAAGLAAGVFLLWWPAHLPSTGVQWLVLRGLAFASGATATVSTHRGHLEVLVITGNAHRLSALYRKFPRGLAGHMHTQKIQ